MPVELPPFELIHDDLFVDLQYGAERMGLLRTLINEFGGGFLEKKLAEETARQNRLADLATLLYRLQPREMQFRGAVAQLLECGYIRYPETA